MIITPRDIEREIQKRSEIKELIEKINIKLSTEAKIKEAICGIVTIEIRENLFNYQKQAIVRLYTKAGWLKVKTEDFKYNVGGIMDPLYTEFTGTRFTFYM